MDQDTQQASSPAEIPPRGWKDILLATWKDAGEDNLSLVSAGVAFYAFLAFVPLLTAFVLSYGLVAEPSSVVGHVQSLTTMMPQNAAELIGSQLQSMVETRSAKTGFALFLAIMIAAYGASKGAGAIITALNIAYEVPETRGFIRRTALALAMTVGAILVLLLAIVAVSALNFVEELLPNLGGITAFLIKAVTFLLAAAAVTVLLAVIYRYGPNRPDATWRWITPGSALATIVWIVATMGFGIYVSNFGNYNATYGSLGAIIVFLTWLYLTTYIVLLGAELNSVLEVKTGQHHGETKGEAPAQGERAPTDSAAKSSDPLGSSSNSGDLKKKPLPLGALVGRLGFYALWAAVMPPRRTERLSGGAA